MKKISLASMIIGAHILLLFPMSSFALNKAEWMNNIPGNQSLAQISIPGTHDSGALKCGAAYKTQSDDLETQLNKGIRYLDIRLRYFGDGLYVHHANCYEGLTFYNGVLKIVHTFLEAHPSETVLMRIKQEYSRVSDANFIARFKNYLVGRSSYIYTDATTPTLNEVRGKIVIISNVYGLSGIPWSKINMLPYSYTWLTPRDMDKLLKNNETLINEAVISHAQGDKQLYLASTAASGHAFPKSYARYINPRINQYFKNHFYDVAHPLMGIITMDFPTGDMIDNIIKKNIPSYKIYAFNSDAGYYRYNTNTLKTQANHRANDNAWKNAISPYYDQIVGAMNINWKAWENNTAGNSDYLYLFLRNGTYMKYDMIQEKMRIGPTPMSYYWRGISNEDSQHIAAVVNPHNGYIYFFLTNGKYDRYSINAGKFTDTHLNTDYYWKKLSPYKFEINAATFSRNTEGHRLIYFFLKNGTSLTYDIDNPRLITKPEEITNKNWGNFSKIKNSISAVVSIKQA